MRTQDERSRRKIFYPVAHCQLRDVVRIFAFERIRSVELGRGRFEVPASFDAVKNLAEAWGMLRRGVVTVRVVFARGLARCIREWVWQKLRDLPDGRVETTLSVAHTLEVQHWIVGFAVQAEVLPPEGLSEEAEGVAAKLTPARAPLAAILTTSPSAASRSDGSVKRLGHSQRSV